jgi:DNA-binding response OmpR family regulator
LVLGSDEPGERAGAGPTLPARLRAVGSETPEERWQDGVISVVVVEDDPAMRLLVRFNLEAEGFEVALAETGADGLRAIVERKPDLVLLDVMLPDVGGFELAAEVTDAPVVFMSARASTADFERGRDAGAIDYVTKPFDPVALPARLREDLIELDRSGSAAHVWALRFGQTS